MKKLLVVLFALTFSILAVAHGPTPQKVQKTVTIAASPDKVWAVVKDFDNGNKWLPFVTGIKLETKGEDKFRTLTLKSGGKILEDRKSVV